MSKKKNRWKWRTAVDSENLADVLEIIGKMFQVFYNEKNSALIEITVEKIECPSKRR